MKAFLAALALFVATLFLNGCKTAPGADPVVVNAERSLSIALAAIDTFVKIERDNSATVKAKTPKTHEFAEWLRQPVEVGGKTIPRGLAFIESARLAKNAYKDNRSPENKAGLETALATVSALTTQVQTHLKSIQ